MKVVCKCHISYDRLFNVQRRQYLSPINNHISLSCDTLQLKFLVNQDDPISFWKLFPSNILEKGRDQLSKF